MHYYEERYRLTGRAAAGLAASALLVMIGFLWHLPVIFPSASASPILDTTAGPPPGEEPGQENGTREAGPAA